MIWWNRFSRRGATPDILRGLKPSAIAALADREVASLLALEACRVVHRKEGEVPTSQRLSAVVSRLVEIQIAIAAAIEVEGITLEQAEKNPILYLPDWLDSQEFKYLEGALGLGCQQIGHAFHLSDAQVAALHYRIEEWIEAKVQQKVETMIIATSACIHGVLRGIPHIGVRP